MIYRYDQPVDMPIPELYDTGLMQAYTQAIREQFEKGEKRLDEFASKYGNFTSPFAKDIQDWDRLTMGRINNIYNDLVSRGIDPLRSREGQMLMAQAIRQTPVGKLNQLRQSAAIGEQYLKAKGDLQAKGLYSQEMEDYFLKHPFSQWSTSENGLFNRTSPLQYKDIHDITDDWFKHSEKKFDEKLTKQKADGYDYYTVSEDDIRGIINSNINDFLDSDYGRYYYQKEKNLVQRLNPTATQDQIENMAMQKFKDDIVNRNSDYLKIDKKANEYALINYKNKLDQINQAREWAHQEKMAELKNSGSGKKKNGEYGSYHQNMLQRALYEMGGGKDYDNATDDEITKYATNAKIELQKKVQDILKGKKKVSVNDLTKLTIDWGAHEDIDFIGRRHNHKKEKNYGTININGVQTEGLTVTNREINSMISKNNWAANMTGSRIKRSSVLQNNISTNIKNKATKRYVFVPAQYGNVATTIEKRGNVVQANRGRLYGEGNDGKFQDYGEVYWPINRTAPTSKDGKSKMNTIIPYDAYRGTVDAQEARIQDIMDRKNSDKYTQIGDYR